MNMVPPKPRRRRTDAHPWKTLLDILLYGDIRMTLLLGGAGLILWVVFGLTAAKGDLANFAAMFPIGAVEFWVFAYLFGGIGMWAIAAYNLPNMASLVVGGWLVTIWTWSFFARSMAIATAQTGNATSLIYIILGVLILQRSGK